MYPNWYIEYRGKYLFNLLKRGVNKNNSMINFYVFDPDNGNLYGPVPVMSIYGNEELSDKLKNPHMLSGEDQQLNHHSPYTDFLMHYGIQGQKWGVRRFQNEDGTLTAEGKERYLKTDHDKTAKNAEKDLYKYDKNGRKLSFSERGRTRTAANVEKLYDALSEDIKNDKSVDREKTKQGETDKRLATDIVFTVLNPFNVAYLAADGAMAIAAKRKLNKYMEDREKNSEKDPKTGLYLKSEGQYNDKQDLAAVNPGFMDFNTNTKNNCMLCTTTYEMRKRGYDVTAQLDSVGYSFPDLKRWFPKAKIENVSRFDSNGVGIKQKEYVAKTINALEKQGDGARGNLMVNWLTGGAHSIFYEVKNGKVFFFDGQANQVYSSNPSFMNMSNKPEVFLGNTIAASYARLDNVKPNMDLIIKECVR